MDGECTSDHTLLLSNNKLRQELQQVKGAARQKDVEQDKELHRLQSEAKESWGLISWCFVTFLVCLIITTVNNWLFQARTVEGQGYIRRVGLRLGLTREGGNITGLDIGFEEVPHCLSLSFHCPCDVRAVPSVPTTAVVVLGCCVCGIGRSPTITSIIIIGTYPLGTYYNIGTPYFRNLVPDGTRFQRQQVADTTVLYELRLT